MRLTHSLLALVIIVSLGGIANADPPANRDLPTVFCFRVTDMERVAADAEGDRFLVEFEVLNWTFQEAAGLNLATNVGTSAGVTVSNAFIDPDGRGGPTGGSEIGAGVFDPISHQSGRGRGDIGNHLNDWRVADQTSTSVTYDALDSSGDLVGQAIPNRDLLFGQNPFGLVPGLGLDALGDSAIDGGPGPYTASAASDLPPSPDGSGNVLDGFVMDIDGFGIGDTLSFNWFLLGVSEAEGSLATDAFAAQPAGNLRPIFGSFGFGTFSLARMDLGGPLPGALFTDNTGFNQRPESFFGNVYEIPNPAEFGAEFGAGITAQFADPDDNVFGVPINTQLATRPVVPEPASLAIWLSLTAAGIGLRRRRRA